MKANPISKIFDTMVYLNIRLDVQEIFHISFCIHIDITIRVLKAQFTYAKRTTYFGLKMLRYLSICYFM